MLGAVQSALLVQACSALQPSAEQKKPAGHCESSLQGRGFDGPVGAGSVQRPVTRSHVVPLLHWLVLVHFDGQVPLVPVQT